MKRYFYFLIKAIYILILFYSSSLYASGRGFNIPISLGNMDYELYDSDVRYGGIGYIYDSNLAGNKLFNYRMNISFEYFEHLYSYYNFNIYNPQTGESSYYKVSGRHKVARLLSDHSFGLGIIKSSSFRYWISPNLRFGFIGADNLGMTIGTGITFFGLNFNIGSKVSLTFETSYLYNRDLFFEHISSRTYFNGLSNFEKETNTATSHLLLLKFSILFRDHNI